MSTYSEALLLALAVETGEKNAQWGAYLKRKKKKKHIVGFYFEF